MKYILSDIRIKDPFPQYEGDGLDINYSISNSTSAHLLQLSNSSLIDYLEGCERILDGDKEDNTVRRGFNYSWISLDLFMQHDLTLSLMEELVLFHLNNKTEKP